jgi:hypothetical protein
LIYAQEKLGAPWQSTPNRPTWSGWRFGEILPPIAETISAARIIQAKPFFHYFGLHKISYRLKFFANQLILCVFLGEIRAFLTLFL